MPHLDLTGIQWGNAGGESGETPRPMETDWVRSIRDLCVERNLTHLTDQSHST